MRFPHFALTEICGLGVDLAVTCLLIFYVGIDPLTARLPGAVAGLATSWQMNSCKSDPTGKTGAFLINAVTLTSRIVSLGLFTLLQWRNPLIQPVISLGFSALAALAFALYGYRRLKSHSLERD